MSSYQLLCHMLISLDGRVTGPYLDHPDCLPYIDDYYRILDDFQGNNWICGRTTFAEFVPLTADLDLTPCHGLTTSRIRRPHHLRLRWTPPASSPGRAPALGTNSRSGGAITS